MPTNKRSFIPNQVFVGLPWNLRKRYDPIVAKLEKKYPLHFSIVGRNDTQDAEDLFEVIKQRIAASSYAIFDATDGNANVSLEFGYAEALEVQRAVYLNVRKPRKKQSVGSPIISDLGGKRRVQYKTDKALATELEKQCREHDYNVRFERAIKAGLKGKAKGEKKRGRALALKIVRALDGKERIRRAELAQHLQAQQYSEAEADYMLKKLHAQGVVTTTKGRYADVHIA